MRLSFLSLSIKAEEGGKVRSVEALLLHEPLLKSMPTSKSAAWVRISFGRLEQRSNRKRRRQRISQRGCKRTRGITATGDDEEEDKVEDDEQEEDSDDDIDAAQEEDGKADEEEEDDGDEEWRVTSCGCTKVSESVSLSLKVVSRAMRSRMMFCASSPVSVSSSSSRATTTSTTRAKMSTNRQECEQGRAKRKEVKAQGQD